MRIDWCRLFTPSSWVQLGEVDWEYDEVLNKQLDKYGITHSGHYTARSGGLSIWISNYPFAYGYPADQTSGYYTLPSMKTRKRIRSLIKKYQDRNCMDQCK